MSIPQKELTLPSGIKVVILEYVTAGLMMDFNLQEEGKKQEFLIKSVVKSLDGVNENVYAKCRELRLNDWVVIDEAVSELISQDLPDKKK